MVQTIVLLTKLSMVIQCADPFLVILQCGPFMWFSDLVKYVKCGVQIG